MSSRAWNNDLVQFARLLCEIAATQNVDLDLLEESMDLPFKEVDDLFERAHDVWEAVKEDGLPVCNQTGPDTVKVANRKHCISKDSTRVYSLGKCEGERIAHSLS